MTYIEDYLEHICEKHLNYSESADAIYFSINKQVAKGMGLTDRQYSLVLNKIQQFFQVEDLPTRIPLREIDRSKYIKIVDNDELYKNSVYESYKQDWSWIKIRFPFAKKDIVAVEKIASVCQHDYLHKKGCHEHYVKFTPLNAYHVYSNLQNRNFTIDETIKEMHDAAKEIIDNKYNHEPVLINSKVYNLPADIQGKINGDIFALQDKSLRYGYTIVNPVTDNTLASQMSARTEQEFLAPPDQYNLNKIAESFLQLDRFPLIVLIDEVNAYDQVTQIYNAFSGFVDNALQSVMFRIDSNDTQNNELNSFVQTKQLNNWVDNTTKIVYIKKNKIPKVLLKSNFVPTTALSIKSDRYNSKVTDWIKFNCDLIVYNDNNFSSFRNWMKW